MDTLCAHAVPHSVASVGVRDLLNLYTPPHISYARTIPAESYHYDSLLRGLPPVFTSLPIIGYSIPRPRYHSSALSSGLHCNAHCVTFCFDLSRGPGAQWHRCNILPAVDGFEHPWLHVSGATAAKLDQTRMAGSKAFFALSSGWEHGIFRSWGATWVRFTDYKSVTGMPPNYKQVV